MKKKVRPSIPSRRKLAETRDARQVKAMQSASPETKSKWPRLGPGAV
jgi:hypothetical protein